MPKFPTSKRRTIIIWTTPRRATSRSIWTHPHFVFAIAAQFFYVAAQAGIFSFLINYMTSEPVIPSSWYNETTKKRDWIEVNTAFYKQDIKNLPAFAERLKEKSDPVSAFISGQLSEKTRDILAGYQGEAGAASLLSNLASDLNKIVRQDPRRVKADEILCVPSRFSGIKLGENTRKLMEQKDKEDALVAEEKRLWRRITPRR